jgi:antitoxin component YwqK of YwqJK toxin-antitoxin module
MNIRIFTIICLLAVSIPAECQSVSDINKTDAQGKKQGHWIKKYPNGVVQYEGDFRDNHPVGEFKRYYEDSKLKSVLIYSSDGNQADAALYYPNGFIESKGTYVNQLKEGKWKFYSAENEGYLINEEEYKGNLRNGLSVKYYPDGAVAEKLTYTDGKKEGDWFQYFQNGKLFLRSYYSDDMLNGKFEVWFENGTLQFSGFYKDNMREGVWYVYNQDGTVRYKLNYTGGYTKDRQMDIDAEDFMNNLEKNKGNIADPEKTGDIR